MTVTESELEVARAKYAEALAVFKRCEVDEPRKRSGRSVGLMLCEAFGLDPNTVCRVELVADVNDAATLTVQFRPAITDSGLSSLVGGFATYELHRA